MSDEVRTFTFTGEAAKSISGGVKKRRSTRKKGGEEAVINLPNVAAAPVTVSNAHNGSLHVPLKPTLIPADNNGSNHTKVIKTNYVSAPIAQPVVTSAPTSVPVTPMAAPVVAPMVAPMAIGGEDKKIKVELTKKQEAKKVHLHPKKDEPQKVAVPKKMETRKRHRKVLLGVSVLHRRMTRAKKMQKKAKDMPLDKLKEELIQKKLIKATSKAPESVLRQIAADAQIVAGKAL
jgi:hypothetical protein